jgi:hypothetical protein
LCSATGAAQTIDKKTFDKLVDYVNCKYTGKYIESFRGQKTMKADLDKYDNIFKGKLNTCTPDNCPSFDNLQQLEHNGWDNTFKNLTKLLDKKKEQFKSNMSIQEAIKLLTTLEGTGIPEAIEKTISHDLISDIQKELNNKYNLSSGDRRSTISSQFDSANMKAEIEKMVKAEIKKTRKAQIKLSPLLWLVCIIVFVSPLIFLFILLWRRSSDKQIEKIVEPLLLKYKSEYENKLEQYENKLKQYENNLEQYENKLKQDIDNSINDNHYSDINTEQNTDTKYVSLYQDRTFYNLSDSPQSCDFKIFNIQGNTADFEFCGDKNTALAHKYIFDGICEIIESTKVPRDIITVEKGKVMMNQKGDWEVTVLSKIKIV